MFVRHAVFGKDHGITPLHMHGPFISVSPEYATEIVKKMQSEHPMN